MIDQYKSTSAASMLSLETPEAWPAALRTYLDDHYSLFLDWEVGPTDTSAKSYDQAIVGLTDRLQPYSLRGWHCTRLTPREIAVIYNQGMHLPSQQTLVTRIEAARLDGLISDALADRLKANNQAHEANRAGKVWFCFFRPGLAGESGIGDLVGYWGGEALYNSHSQYPEAGALLRAIGRPAIVEADVPIAWFPSGTGLALKIARRYLIWRGHSSRERCDHEDRIVHPLPATHIRRIVQFPDPAFLELTGCDSWRVQPRVIC